MLAILFLICIGLMCLPVFAVSGIVYLCSKRRKDRSRVAFPIMIVSGSALLVNPILWGILGEFAHTLLQEQVDTGETVYWTDEYSEFEWNGITYIEYENTELSFADDYWITGAPVANLKSRSEDNGLLSAWFGDSGLLLRPIENGREFTLYTTGKYGIYCPKSQEDEVTAYYSDLSNYDLNFVVCQKTEHMQDAQKAEGDEMVISVTDFDLLLSIQGESSQVIDLHGKDYQKYKMKFYSEDRVAYNYVVILEVEGQRYREVGWNDGELYVVTIPQTINTAYLDSVEVK